MASGGGNNVGGNPAWYGSPSYATKQQLISTATSFLSSSGSTNNLGSTFSTLYTSSLYANYISTGVLNASSIVGNPGVPVNINQLVVSTLQGNLLSLSTLSFNPSVSSLKFAPTITLGSNFGSGIGNAIVGGLTSLLPGLFGVVAGTAGAGVVLNTGLNALTRPRAGGNINGAQYEEVNATSQIQISTLGFSGLSPSSLYYSTIYRFVSSTDGGKFAGVGVEYFASTLFAAGTKCVRTAGDPEYLLTAPTSSIQAFSQWVPLLDNDSVLTAKGVSTVNVSTATMVGSTIALGISKPSYTLDVYAGTIGNAFSMNVSRYAGVPTTTGTVSSNITGGYTYYCWTIGSGSITLPATTTADVLVVAGGGSGGADYNNGGGGGGAGGILFLSNISLTAGSYSVVVGAGGTATSTVGVPSGSGSNSVFSGTPGTFTAFGGGGGGWGPGGGSSGAGNQNNGASGGSGGGGGGASSQSNSGGAATQTNQGYAGYGNNGGTGITGYANGGGGGAGGVGGSYNGSGVLSYGGVGLATWSAWGSATSTGQNVSGTYYYGGGGAGGYGNLGPGGYGGGGNGGSSTSPSTGFPGLANTGGGGGGGGYAGAPLTWLGGAGGSGVVIVRVAYTGVPNTAGDLGTFTTDTASNAVVSAPFNIRLNASSIGVNQSTPYYALDVSGAGRFTSSAGVYFGTGGARIAAASDGGFYTVNNANVSSPLYQQTFVNSTVQGLGTIGYLSSFAGIPSQAALNSTVVGLGTIGYISTAQLVSTSAGVLSSNAAMEQSTVRGLGTAGYVSSITGFPSQINLNSTVQGLGTAGYVSSLQLFSTTAGLITYANSVGTGASNYANSVGTGASNYAGSLAVSTGAGLITYTNTVGTGASNYAGTQVVSTGAGLITYANAVGTGASNYAGSLAVSTGAGVLLSNAAMGQSTVQGLGTAGYISSTQLFSTTTGLNTYIVNYATYAANGVGTSTSNYAQTIGVGASNYAGSLAVSTGAGLITYTNTVGTGASNYAGSLVVSTGAGVLLSNAAMGQSTVQGLGTTGYVSTVVVNSSTNRVFVGGVNSNLAYAQSNLTFDGSNLGVGTFTPAFTLDVAGGTIGNILSATFISSLPTVSVSVSGGTLGTNYTITTDGTYTYYNFLTTGITYSLTLSNAMTNVKYFAIAGGGGGGFDYAGGGGGGGVRSNTSVSLTAQTYSIVVGVGGTGGSTGIYNGTNGSNTTMTGTGLSISAVGGGGGAGFSDATGNGLAGGCGGGGGSRNGGFGIGGTGSQGSNGGNGLANNYPSTGGGGGGGGAGGAGQATTTGVGGTGGTGVGWNNGTALRFGGGGGGGALSTYSTSSDGGGRGGYFPGVYGVAGTANTGGGGGGGGAGSGFGGAGGSGYFSIGFLPDISVLTQVANLTGISSGAISFSNIITGGYGNLYVNSSNKLYWNNTLLA